MPDFMTDLHAMRDSAKKFHGHADNIAADAGKAWAAAQNMAGSWDGKAATMSLGTMEEMNRAFGKIRDMCSDTGDKLAHAADQFEAQEAANTASLNS